MDLAECAVWPLSWIVCSPRSTRFFPRTARHQRRLAQVAKSTFEQSGQRGGWRCRRYWPHRRGDGTHSQGCAGRRDDYPDSARIFESGQGAGLRDGCECADIPLRENAVLTRSTFQYLSCCIAHAAVFLVRFFKLADQNVDWTRHQLETGIQAMEQAERSHTWLATSLSKRMR